MAPTVLIMYGKHFESLYDGSMFGRPALMFAVWSYAITKQKPAKDGMCYVELNPVLLAATFADTVDNVIAVITELESPDARSRSQELEGRRIVRVDADDVGAPIGPTQFRVVNGPKYRAIRDEDDRREYLREAKRRERAKKSTNVNIGQQSQQPSTQSEARDRSREQKTGSQSLLVAVAPEKSPTKQPKRSAKELVEEFKIEQKHREWAASEAPSVPIDRELGAWKDRMRTNDYTTGKAPGKPVRDAQAAFYTAMRNAEVWGTYRQQGRQDGRPDGRSTPRDSGEGTPKTRIPTAAEFGHRDGREVLRELEAKKLHSVRSETPGGPDDSMR